jgi:hypothetical protein
VRSIGTILETLFRPSDRWADFWRRHQLPQQHRHRLPGRLTQFELLPGLTFEHVLAAGITWEDFRRFARRKIVWMTSDVYICTCDTDFSTPLPTVLLVGANASRANLCVHVAEDDSRHTAAAATASFLLRLLVTSDRPYVYIEGGNSAVPTPLSGESLSLFFRESQSCLHQVTLDNMALSEDLCNALGTMSRLDVEVKISGCSLSNDAGGAFVECLRSDSDRGPVKLNKCRIDSQILASALTGDSRVTQFERDSFGVSDTETAVLFAALANNRGLLDLDLYHNSISDENWSVLCVSLQTHPTLTRLNLQATTPIAIGPFGEAIILSDEQKAQRTRLLAEMARRNISLHTIALSADERDQQIYIEMIHPFLETNRYRPRVRELKKVDISLRRPLLGLVLQTESVRYKSDLLWMFLSENADIVVLSNEDGEQVEVPTASAPVEVSETSKRKR